MTTRRFPSAVALLIAFSCIARLQAAEPQKPIDPKDLKFLRYVEDKEGGAKLQTAIVNYRNAAGAQVHLVGAVHVGERAYYKDLDKTFATYDALLYEMIKPKDAPVPAPGAGAQSDSLLSMFQRLLKDVLELEFQLDSVDYSAKNFVHADLDVETFYRLQEERGESFVTLLLRQMLHEMQNPSNAPQVTLPELVVALTSPDSARHFKMILGRQFENIEAQVAGLEGPNGSVILTERNKKAIEVLKTTLAAGRKNVGIFYGAAHLKDLDERIRAMGFEISGVEWRTAWDMTPKEGDIILKVYKKPKE